MLTALFLRELAPKENALGVSSASHTVYSSLDVRKPTLGRNPSKCGKSFQQNYDFLTHHRSHIGENVGICLECGESIRWRIFSGLNNTKSRLRRSLVTSEKSCPWPAPLVYQGTHTNENPVNISSLKKVLLETSTFGPQRTYSVENFALVRDLVVDLVHIIDMRITVLTVSWPLGWRRL